MKFIEGEAFYRLGGELFGWSRSLHGESLVIKSLCNRCHFHDCSSGPRKHTLGGEEHTTEDDFLASYDARWPNGGPRLVRIAENGGIVVLRSG